METIAPSQREVEKKTETPENTSDHESSVESFHTNKSELSITTEAELIDVDEIELSDEESWLYQSPKKVPTDEKSISTQKWLQSNSEDMDDMELKETRHALLSKLNQLKQQKSRIENQPERKDFKLPNSAMECSSSPLKSEKLFADGKNIESKTVASESKNSQVCDVVDVHKIARLQEESLKQSTYKFLNNSGKRTPNSRDLSPASPTQVLNLSKPVSAEGLNMVSNKAAHYNVFSGIPLDNIKKQSLFGSSSAINTSPEIHRCSLPNINNGYYSLKSKKSKRPSEPKVSCPLPIYPTQSKATQNGSLLKDQRQSSTLPSSYRINSRRNSSSHRDMNSRSPSSRRESKPFAGSNPSLSHQRKEFVPFTGNSSPFSSPRRESLPYTGNSSPLSSPRRESLPFTGSNSPLPSLRREFMSHTGNNSPLLNQRRESSPYTSNNSPFPGQRENHRKYSSPDPSTRYNALTAVSPSKTFSTPVQGLKSPPGADYHRAPSHSPSRRLPLSTVQQVLLKKENSLTSPKNGEIRALPVKIGSKIPGPGMRSARPVPSTCSPRATGEHWNEDCY